MIDIGCRIATISRAFPNHLTVMSHAIVIGQWAAHPTGKIVTDPADEEGYEHQFAEWSITHVPTGLSPVALSIEWWQAVNVTASLHSTYPPGSDPREAAGGRVAMLAAVESALELT